MDSFSFLLTTQAAHFAPKVTWLVLRELALHSSSCPHPTEIWLGETWLQKLACHLPPLHSQPSRSLRDHLDTKRRNSCPQNRDAVAFKRQRSSNETKRGKKRLCDEQGSETLYRCRKGGWMHRFSVTSCLVTYSRYGRFVIQYSLKSVSEHAQRQPWILCMHVHTTYRESVSAGDVYFQRFVSLEVRLKSYCKLKLSFGNQVYFSLLTRSWSVNCWIWLDDIRPNLTLKKTTPTR